MAEINITPNASKTIESLRHLTYTNTSALADIVDNSLDAGANNIIVDISKEEITILDDGCGMNIDVMREAIKLGSNTNKDKTELGRFGMGLVTAGISMARRIDVVSKVSGGEIYKVSLDLDEIAKTNEWKAIEDAPNMNDSINLSNLESGTLIRLSQIDNMDRNISSNVKKEFSRIFRKFIEAGVNIFVKGEKLESNDPLEIWRPETEILFDDDVEIDGEKLHVKLVMLDPNSSSQVSTERGYSITNQGFYVVRNNREIDEAATLGIYNKHQDFNHMRGEISYASDLDEAFGINFTKNRIRMSQSLTDKLKMVLTPGMRLIRQRNIKKRQVEGSKQIDHSDSESIISKRKALLRTPGVKEKRGHREKSQNSGSAVEKNSPTGKKRENLKNIQPGNRAMPARITEVDLGSSGDLFSYRFEGSTIIIEWNISHPFHTNMIAKYSGDKDIVTPLDFFVYSLVSAELSIENEDTVIILEQIRSALSSNLRVLMQ